MENYDQMVRMLAKEELRIVQLRESLKKDTLTGCLNRNAFGKKQRTVLFTIIRMAVLCLLIWII